MRTTIELPDQVFRMAKRVAVENGSTLREFVTRAVVHELDGRGKRMARSRRALPSVSVPKDAAILRMSPEELARVDADEELRGVHAVRRRR